MTITLLLKKKQVRRPGIDDIDLRPAGSHSSMSPILIASAIIISNLNDNYNYFYFNNHSEGKLLTVAIVRD